MAWGRVGKRGRGDGRLALGASSPRASWLLLGCRCQPAPKTQQRLPPRWRAASRLPREPPGCPMRLVPDTVEKRCTVPHRQTLGPPSPWSSGFLHGKTPGKQQFALHACREDVSWLSQPQWTSPCPASLSPAIDAPTWVPACSALPRGDAPEKPNSAGRRCSEATNSCFLPPFQGSNAEASLPHGRALWDHRLTPQQLRAEQPPS